MEQAGDTVSDHRKIIKIFRAVQIVISLLPMVWIAFFYILGFHMAHVFGRWPIPMRDDPGRTVPDGLYSTIDCAIQLLAATLLFFIPVGVVMALFMPRKHRFLPDLPTIILGIGVAGLVFVTQVDPHHLFDWWMD